MTIYFDADRFFYRGGAGLMRRLIEHGSENEELAGCGLFTMTPVISSTVVTRTAPGP